jgi:holo-ACP synthase/triphosphoribosyl-dephospho-CoA synthase
LIEPLNSILEAREQRGIFKKFLAGKGRASLSFSLNIPGYPKSNSIAKSFFGLCLTDLKYHLKSHLIEIFSEEAIEICDAAGDFFLAPFTGGILSLQEIKQICEDFEERHPLGRFLDVDLNDELGNTVSSGKSKLCFFCKDQPAIECRRSNAHDPELLRSYMFSDMAEYCRIRKESQIVKRLSTFALSAILNEISLTPKPGLVDKFSNGSHSDMDYQTFINSSAAISGWFEELVRAGLHFQQDDLTKALPVIRNIGLQMEAAMYEATGHINTQKGIIFLMGLSLFATGKLYRDGDLFDSDRFRGIVRDICKDLVRKELKINPGIKGSHGEVVFQKFGFSGARGEAESGFETVFEKGLPMLAGMKILNDQSLISCFLAIASTNSDTNILYRCGPEVLTSFQHLCKNALDNFTDANYAAIGEFCRRENISPGGSADLLAVSIFLWLLMNNVFTD